MFERARLTLSAIMLLIAAGTSSAAERPVVREVLVVPDGNGARIEIRADKPLVYRSYLMPQLEKWVIDLAEATTTYSDDESKKMRTPPLERVTVRHKEVNGDLFTRIGLDFKGEVDFLIREDPLDKGHLLVFLTPKKTAKPQAVAAAEAAPQSPTGTSAGPVAVRPAGKTSARAVTAIEVTAASIKITADGKMAMTAPFRLTKPGRLVLDLTGITSNPGKVSVPDNRFGIVRCRLGENNGKLRIVFEASGDTFPDFRVQEILNGVEITPQSESLKD